MRNLQQAAERICELKGNLVALESLIVAALSSLSNEERDRLRPAFERCAEAARSSLIQAPISEHTIAAFESRIARTDALLDEDPAETGTVEPLLLTTVRVRTFEGPHPLTGASGFFFERDDRLYLVTCRHVLYDEQSGHRPDRIEIALHIDEHNLTRFIDLSILLYRDGLADWRQAEDSGGPIDVAVLPLERSVLPPEVVLRSFRPEHIRASRGRMEVGRSVRIVGFPLGFHDTLHHLPVVRQAAVASSFGLRFQGRGYFLTDARTHRGTSGAPVLVRMRRGEPSGSALPWALLGVHASRLDVGNRDRDEDESLGLNCAWYADVLMALTAE